MVPVPVLEESREPGMALSSHRLVWKVLTGHSPCGHGIRDHKKKGATTRAGETTSVCQVLVLWSVFFGFSS